MTSRISRLALRCDADSFDTSRKELMGRHVAGSSFLRALFSDFDTETDRVFGFTESQNNFEAFRRFAQQCRPGLSPGWVRPQQNEILSKIGTLHFPDPSLREQASLRLRRSPQDYSITGVTHTTASFGAMEMIRAIATAPVMPWDALICTSQSVKNTVSVILEAEAEYLKWRLGLKDLSWTCQLPIIPLGLHVQDFETGPQDRIDGRLKLGIKNDEIVFMFIGRLNPFVKANPLVMYSALEAAAKRTKKKVTLIECGWFHAEKVKQMQTDARSELAPSINYKLVDGRVEAEKWRCWAASDVFISLSDNIQETFGLTPVEAMAAGKPCLVSDWNGYRELVEDGQQGFRIPTAMSDETEPYAHAYEAGADYGRYCAGVSHSTQVDIAVLVDRLITLIDNSETRKAMAQKGKDKAREKYDWSVVYPQYQSLWGELEQIRLSARNISSENVPKALPSRLPPSATFNTYPTRFIENDTVVQVRNGATIDDYVRFQNIELNRFSLFDLPESSEVEAFFVDGKKSVQSSASETGRTTFWIKRIVGTLLKWGLLEIVEE